jgi:hypothetical protein
MNANRATFLKFSEEVTGYSSLDLEGTGLVDVYQAVVEGAIGDTLGAQFYALAAEVVSPVDPVQRENGMRAQVLPSAIFWPVVSNLISLWYLGSWTILPDSWFVATGRTKPGVGETGSSGLPSSQATQAYIEQLSYRTAGAHTPGARPTGYGSWSIPPVLGS